MESHNVWLFTLDLMFLRPRVSCHYGLNDAAMHLVFTLSKSWLVSVFDPWEEFSEGGALGDLWESLSLFWVAA